MKRQQVRQAMLLVSLLLFPITLYYFSPVLGIAGAFEGIIAGCLVMFALQFILSLFLGRAFCAWVCPAGGIGEACFRVNPRRAGRGRWIKYLIWTPWLIGLTLAFAAGGRPRGVNLFYQTVGGISVAQPLSYVVYYGFVGLMVILSLTAGKRAFCHYVCWMAPFMSIGSKLRDLFGWPALRLRVRAEACRKCGLCTKVCPMSLDVQEMAQKGQMGSSDCILCGECADACPSRVIGFAFRSSAGRSKRSTHSDTTTVQ